MIDPVIFTINLFGLTLTFRWYGLLIGVAVLVGGLIAEREMRRRGGVAETVWDMLLWVVPAGIVGARLGYVLNDIAGGGQYFLQDPRRIFYITEGGLHIYGALVLGLLAAYAYSRRHPLDLWMFLDSIAPALLFGQAAGRPANFINQELYGPPTDLPWGIPISAEHRIGAWRDLSRYPEETTRFHPAFAYEILWNVITGSALLWLTRKYPQKFKPGAAIFLWMVFAGVGRFIIESFRPDQPRIPGTDISWSRLAAGLLAVFGGVLLAARMGWLKSKLKFPEKYTTR
ncbi:MAG: prolipoprotein diacylglyceryl transferase [Chloroflexi bacterium]|nr:prolipoprotein diacylglyceryl transferase [Chloroflexota bacterium]